MLVLTRKNQESVVVGGTDRFQRILKVKVLEIKGEKVFTIRAYQRAARTIERDFASCR